MTFKKIMALQLLLISSTSQSFELANHKFTDKEIETLTTYGIVGTAAACLTYLWATSGDTVDQRIQDAQEDLATMPEYDQELDISTQLGEKETQITNLLKQLNINLANLSTNYDLKLQADLTILQAAYTNLWYKSFYGGSKIREVTRKVYAIKTKIENLIKYLQTHHKFLHGHKIINQASALPTRSALQNDNEVLKAAKAHDAKTAYPLVAYLKKIQKDLACIEFLITQKSAQKDYPQLSTQIGKYQSQLEEIKYAIAGMESYKAEAFAKLDNDIEQLQEQCAHLEAVVANLQSRVRSLECRG